MKILLSIGARAEDSRSMRMTDMGTSMVAGLGKSASPEGSECMTLVVNDGKIVGSSCKRVRRFFATHNNPAQDAGAALGGQLVVRRNVMLETVPPLTDLKANFDTYVSRSAMSEKKGVDYDTQRQDMNSLLSAAGTKYRFSAQQTASFGTHFPRHDTANTLGDNDVSEEQIKRLLSAPANPLEQTYMTGAPLEAVAMMGGSKNAADHRPSWLLDEGDLPEGTLEVFCPWLTQQKAELAEIKAATAETSVAMKEARVVALENSVNAQRRAVRSFVCAAAARPFKDGKIDESSPAIHDKYKQTNKALALPYFDSASFLGVKALVKAAQDAEIEASKALQVPTPIKEAYEKHLKARDEMIMSKLTVISQKVTALSQPKPQQQQQQQQQLELPAAPATATATAAEEEPPKKKEKKGQRRSNNVETARGQVHIKEMSSFKNASDVYEAYFVGINGGESYEQLEKKGKAWRKYKGARDAWCKLGLLARFLERKEADGDKQSAVDQLQALADNAGKQGDSDAPNWKKVLSELRKDPAELKRKQDNNEERASKRQK